MIENVASQVAEVASRIHCINRWCVTGTPLKSSVGDLFGLLLFLKEPSFGLPNQDHAISMDVVPSLSKMGRPSTYSDADWSEYFGPRAGELQWRSFVHSSSEDAMVSFLSQILWRSSKQHVREELGLPPQTTHVVTVPQDEVSREFYAQQFAQARKQVDNAFDKMLSDLG